MNRHPLFLVILLSVLIIAGCSSRREMAAHLSDIALYINDRPDSALAQLRAIDTTILRSRRDKAQYSLLHAMALDKCYIDVTSDSIIASAARYYRHHGSPDDKMKALFYEGVVYQYSKEYNKAAILFSQAEKWAGKAEDTHAKGILFLAFSEVYRKVLNLDKQQEYVEKALDVLAGTGDSLYDRAFGQLAFPYMFRREWATADSLFQRALEKSRDNPAMMKFIISGYGRMKLLKDTPDPEGAIELFNLKIKEYGGSLAPEEAGAYAYASSLIGDNATTDALTKRFLVMKKDDWIAVLPWMYRISAWRGDYQSAFRYLNESHIEEESTIQNTLKDPITQTLQDFQTLSLERERNRKRIISLFSALLLLIAALFVLIATLRKLNIQHEMDALLSIHESLKMEHQALLIRSEKKNDSSRNKKKDKMYQVQTQLRKERIDSFRKRKVFDYMLWMNENRLLSDANTLKELKTEIMSFYKIERNQKELEKELDTSLDGLVSDLKKELSINVQKDVHFLCLWLLDTKPIVVAEILGMNENAVYIKRSRLKKSIASLGGKYSYLLS